MKYGFYGWENADPTPVCTEFAGISGPRDLYECLLKIWSEDTCAPRMRSEWKKHHPSFGQCSVTAFLAQDLFGGRVLGVPLPDGNFHCFNQVGDRVFDLTSEQFDHPLSYASCPEQFRETHFAKSEKYERYLLLKARLEALCGSR